ncbi:MAG: hypothetical protein AAF371_18910 [Pseudomonadota bacterium]
MSAVLIIAAFYMACASFILWLGFFHPRQPRLIFASASTSARASLATAGAGIALMQIGF